MYICTHGTQDCRFSTRMPALSTTSASLTAIVRISFIFARILNEIKSMTEQPFTCTSGAYHITSTADNITSPLTQTGKQQQSQKQQQCLRSLLK